MALGAEDGAPLLKEAPLLQHSLALGARELLGVPGAAQRHQVAPPARPEGFFFLYSSPQRQEAAQGKKKLLKQPQPPLRMKTKNNVLVPGKTVTQEKQLSCSLAAAT